jgi:hypothetical protein
MDAFLKIPIWKPGKYSKLIVETTKIHNDKIIFDKYLFFKVLDENKMIFSSYGFAYDLHKLYKNVPGKIKTELMNNITSK